MRKKFEMKRLLCFAVAFLLIFRLCAAPSFAEGAVEEKSVEEVIREGFYGFRDSVDISGYNVSPTELGEIFSYILKDDPYLFFVDRNLSYSFVPGGGVVCIKPRYTMSGIEIFEAWSVCRDYVREVARLALEKGGELERALFVHDYICENFFYDESFWGDDLYKMITSGSGTCQGYTDLYSAILRECGIESHFVASDTVGHIWNYVKVDGEWYHSDTTWDDLDGGYRHRHFLLNDEAATERGHSDWYSAVDVSCEARIYDDERVEELRHGSYDAGDVDHGGVSDLYDLVLLRRATDIADLNALCAKCADLTADGAVDIADLSLLREKTAKKGLTD